MHKCLTEKQIRNAKERAGGPCVEEVDRNPLHLPTEKNNFSIRVYLAIVYFYTPSMISAYGLQHTHGPIQPEGGEIILKLCLLLHVTIGYSDNSFTFELSAK